MRIFIAENTETGLMFRTKGFSGIRNGYKWQVGGVCAGALDGSLSFKRDDSGRWNMQMFKSYTKLPLTYRDLLVPVQSCP